MNRAIWREPSTWAGLGAIASTIGAAFPALAILHVVALGIAGACGALAVAMREQGGAADAPVQAASAMPALPPAVTTTAAVIGNTIEALEPITHMSKSVQALAGLATVLADSVQKQQLMPAAQVAVSAPAPAQATAAPAPVNFSPSGQG